MILKMVLNGQIRAFNLIRIICIASLLFSCINSNTNNALSGINNIMKNPPIDSLKKWGSKNLGFNDVDGVDVVEIDGDTL